VNIKKRDFSVYLSLWVRAI